MPISSNVDWTELYVGSDGPDGWLSGPVPAVSQDVVGLVYTNVGDVGGDVPPDAVQQRFIQDGPPHLSLFRPPETQDVLLRVGRKALIEALRDVKDDPVFGSVVRIYGPDRFERGEFSNEWYVSVRWPTGNRVRRELGYDHLEDFHITVGFDMNGVQGVEKTDKSLNPELDDMGSKPMSYEIPAFEPSE